MTRLPADVLTDAQRRALHASVVLLIDDALDALGADDSLEDSSLVFELPDRLRHRYTESTFRRLLVSLVDVGGQLARTDTPELRCTADALALHAIISHTEVWLDSTGQAPMEWGDYQDSVFEDLDFELLYRPEWDGIEDGSSKVAAKLGMRNLDPDDWFDPLYAHQEVHPYLADPPPQP